MQFCWSMSVLLPNHIIQEKIFSFELGQFEQMALSVFHYQYEHNVTYRNYCNFRNVIPESVTRLEGIPFLPIRQFKKMLIKTGEYEPEHIFESSGTTGSIPSRHAVRSLNLYKRSFRQTFEQFYGSINSWCVIALLPSYLERQHSSLVYMADDLIQNSNHPDSGFYLYNHDDLTATLLMQEKAKQKTLLIGVSFALLDFAAEFREKLTHTIVMETGGMKGRKKEISKQALHQHLKDAWSLDQIHSEYGMTELMSQAYSTGDGIFQSPKQLRILVRSEDDPTTILVPQANTGNGLRGGINIIDLHNIDSCSFIETEDYGTLYSDGRFSIEGRMENSDLRGCGLMIS